MSSSTFPNELWMNIFEILDSPSDLASVVRTSRRFQLLGERILYKCLIWTNPRSLVENYAFLAANGHLYTSPRSLTLGISRTYHPNNDLIEQINRAKGVVHPDGIILPVLRSSHIHEVRVADDTGLYNDIEYLASERLADMMYNMATEFTNLRELSFVGMILPNTFYSFVHNFPSLDKLRIEDCTVPITPEPTNLHPCDLPITELTILGLRGRRDVREMRALAEGKQLRVIRFDWTCYIYKHFCRPMNGPGNGQPMWQFQGFAPANQPGVHFADTLIQFNRNRILLDRPRELSPHIHTIDVKFPTLKSWQSYVLEPHEHLINPFAKFLEICPGLTCLTIRNHLPWIRLAEDALPNLVHFQGPLTTIKYIMSSSRPIRRLDIRDPSGSLLGLEKSFKDIELAGAEGSLEDLSIYLSCWDDEILYAILHHFRGLKTLEMRYKDGEPSEEIILAMGAHFFGQMPNLVSVHVFKYGCEPIASVVEQVKTRGHAPGHIQSTTGTKSEVEANLKELITAWNRYCPQLREVQLQADYVWRRAGADDVWTKRKYVFGRRFGDT
ncbi:hypothetical protein F5I97DRAFT_1253571 [Phlebopus sp. FC_14]|nr:hypothetical protein F5I97DRAFT_1253571 [Phlebopus sp. FC_14]